MMAANKMNPTAVPLVSWPRALDGYASSVILGSFPCCCPAGHVGPAATDDRLHIPTRAGHGHHPFGMTFGAAPAHLA
jgi:hypothetical protein